MIIDSPVSTAVAALRNQEISAEALRTVADGVSELIRSLNHATQPWSAPAALPATADTARLIGALHEITHHLHQTLDQTGDRIAATGHDSEEARRAAGHLGSAREALREVTRHLAQAHAAAAQLSG